MTDFGSGMFVFVGGIAIEMTDRVNILWSDGDNAYLSPDSFGCFLIVSSNLQKC